MALAQTEPPSAAREAIDRVEAFSKTLSALFDRPLHPLVDTVAPRGWGGVGFEAVRLPAGQPLTWRAQAIVTFHGYADAEGTVRYEHRDVRTELFGRVRDMTRLDYWGLGGASSAADRSDFEYLDRSAGVQVSVPIAGLAAWRAGGRIERLWPSIRPGSEEDLPSLTDRYTDADTPGLGTQPVFTVYMASIDAGSASASLDDPDHLGSAARGTFRVYRGGAGAFDFDRATGEAWQRLRGAREHDRWGFHEYLSVSSPFAGARVPFYLQETLGGFDAVRAVGDDLVATDGTNATLRGFANLRFRGSSLVLAQTEYRLAVTRLIEVGVFGDAGEVADRAAGLQWSTLRGDVGASVTVKADARTSASVSVAHGGEGFQVSIGVMSVLQR